MTTTPNQLVKRGNLFIVPVGPSIADAPPPVQSFTKPPDNSLWVHGQILEPGLYLDRARMSPRLYQEVREDLTRYSPVEVTRSAFRRSSHAYVGVIDSRGTPYYFALDSRGVSVHEAGQDDAAWKAFDRLSDAEHKEAVRERRADAASEMRQVDRELSGPTLVVVKSGEVDAAKHAGLLYAAVMRRMRVDDIESGVDIDDFDPPRPDEERLLDTLVVVKALPKKAKSEGTKKAPSSKASKKQAGAGGKTRYSYPQEKSGGSRHGGQVPLVVVHDDTKHADPGELANQLGVSVRTLQRTARHLGSDGFSSFMRARLKRFAAKHRLDPDYWNTLYANLIAAPNGDVVKSDTGLKEFGERVKTAASAVPHDHPNRFGDRKVFIHHVHSEMKRHGTYSGSLDEFKHHVAEAHKQGHLTAARADLIAAMDPHSVKQSETHAGPATFHFINNVKHDPDAAKKTETDNKTKPESKTSSKPRMSSKFHQEIAHTTSQEAHEASAHAARVGTREAHLAAMTAHHHAGVAHQKATGRVSNKTALKHFDHATAHLKASKEAT